MHVEKLSNIAIGSAIEVHRQLGPGLLESAYHRCLMHELSEKGISFESEQPMPVIYKAIKLDHGYRMDLVLEIKTIESFTDVHIAQLLTYLKLGDYKLGLLINFNVSLLKNGIKRIIN